LKVAFEILSLEEEFPEICQPFLGAGVHQTPTLEDQLQPSDVGDIL
jgi:hypothetical protein